MGIISLVVPWISFVLTLVYGFDVPGVPDDRHLKTRISRGSGVGVISFGYIVIVLIVFALFVVLMALALFYKRERGIRGKEKTLFLTTY